MEEKDYVKNFLSVKAIMALSHEDLSPSWRRAGKDCSGFQQFHEHSPENNNYIIFTS